MRNLQIKFCIMIACCEFRKITMIISFHNLLLTYYNLKVFVSFGVHKYSTAISCIWQISSFVCPLRNHVIWLLPHKSLSKCNIVLNSLVFNPKIAQKAVEHFRRVIRSSVPWCCALTWQGSLHVPLSYDGGSLTW